VTQTSLFDAYGYEPADPGAAPMPASAEPAAAPTPSGRAWDRECPLPVAPSATPQARHASATGAQYAAGRRGLLTLRYLSLLKRLVRLSDHEAAGMLGVGLSSINSTRAKLGSRIVAAPEALDDIHRWPNGHTTRRTRWQLAPGTEGGTSWDG